MALEGTMTDPSHHEKNIFSMDAITFHYTYPLITSHGEAISGKAKGRGGLCRESQVRQRRTPGH
jgi:hypothetical protein